MCCFCDYYPFAENCRASGNLKLKKEEKTLERPEENKKLFVKNCELFYRQAGEKTGKDVILLHGAKFSSATWEKLGTLALLAENGYRVFALDMPGFGSTPKCDRISPVEVLAGFMAEKNIASPVIIGPSMGGAIALEYFFADDRLSDTLYNSPAGPIAPIDILYGHRPSLAAGNLFMAHKTGFTAKTLGQAVVNSGFMRVKVKRNQDNYSLWAIGYKTETETP